MRHGWVKILNKTGKTVLVWTLTPAPEFALCGDEETVGSTGSRHHTANLDIIETSIAMGAPQILPKVPVSSCKNTQTRMKSISKMKILEMTTTHTLPLSYFKCEVDFCTWPICLILRKCSLLWRWISCSNLNLIYLTQKCKFTASHSVSVYLK